VIVVVGDEKEYVSDEMPLSFHPNMYAMALIVLSEDTAKGLEYMVP